MQDKLPEIAVIEFEGAHLSRFSSCRCQPEQSFTRVLLSLVAPQTGARLHQHVQWGLDLWQQPLDGGPPNQIANFKSDLMHNFASSRDGRDIAVARCSHTRDAVLNIEVK